MTQPYSQCRLKVPRSLPLNLEEAKNYLKIDFADDDKLLVKMISAATQKFENYTSRVLIAQTWQVTYRQLARVSVTLPIKPVIRLKGIQLVSFDGQTTEYDLEHTELDARISELYFHTFPYGYLVKVQYLAGYGYSAEEVPDDIKASLLNHVGYLYENRSLAANYPLSTYDEFKLMRL